MKYAITQLDIDLKGLNQGLVNLRAELQKRNMDLALAQRQVNSVTQQIADMETRAAEVDAALKLLNATQFIADETKGSAQDLGL